MNRIEYMLTEADLIQFQLYFSANSNQQQAQRRKYRLRVPLIYLILSLILCAVRAFGAAAFFAIFGAAWFLLAPKWLQRHYRKYFTKHVAETVGDSLKNPIIIELQPDGIYTSSYMGEGKHWYSSVEKIVEDNNYTYIFLGKKMAHILPHDRIPADTIKSIVAEITKKKQEALKP